MDDSEKSLSDEATFAGAAKRRPTAEMSLGDERTLGDQDTVIDDIEVVDLETRYKVEGTLGQGGMGAVLLATDTRLGRKVAVKRILGEAARSKTAIMRFLTEAKAIAALNHPNIVQIYDYGWAKDGPFLTMEYVDGGSLLDRCREGALPLEDAIDLACQLCDGLAKAHDAGIVHRDIKPANVLLNKDGLPKLTDFGLAKAEATDHQMTMTGAVMGTPDFMPPEQRRDAAEVDARSDLWSLAATVYQMVTGRSPKVIAVRHVPDSLQDVLTRALEDCKDDRYQTARELRDALKTSMRAAAVAMPDVLEGKCPSCGEQNDSSRRFCRRCGESLEAPCLSCDKPMPVWEEICGSCGMKQEPLLTARRVEFVARQVEAESLLKANEFEQAESLSATLCGVTDPRLREFGPWAKTFSETIQRTRNEQVTKCARLLDEALRHESAYDYPAGINALAHVPVPLRDKPIAGQDETVASVLARINEKQAETERLERLVKTRIAEKNLENLLPEVQKLFALRPDRGDVKELVSQLGERAIKAESHRDNLLSQANSLYGSQQYEAALAALGQIAPSVMTPNVVKLREKVEATIARANQLAVQIKSFVAEKQFDGLDHIVDAYLKLRSSDNDMLKLRESLNSRENQIRQQLKEIVPLAAQAWRRCDFDQSRRLLQQIPTARQTREVHERLTACEQLSVSRNSLLAKAQALTDHKSRVYFESHAVRYLAAIAAHGLDDPEVQELRDDAIVTQRAQATLRSIFLAIGVGLVALVVFMAAIWIHKSYRLSAIESAIAEENWGLLLSLDEDNPKGFLMRARAKLQATPPDIEGAFADLERSIALGLPPGEITSARGLAYVKRAIFFAEQDNLAAAQQDLDEAGKLVADAAELAMAREAIRPLRANALLLESRSVLAAGDPTTAVGLVRLALKENLSAATNLLQSKAFKPVAEAFIRQAFNEVEVALAKRDWTAAIAVITTAEPLDPNASTWIGRSKMFTAFSSEDLANLPPAVISRLSPLRNSIGIDLKLIPAGTFTMGQTDGDSDEVPHQVTQTKPFYIGVHEVTNAQWKHLMGGTTSTWQGDDRPVEQVDWEDSNEFCRRLSVLPEEKQAGRVYRLPTEAEWEYACRAGTTTKFSSGDEESKLAVFGWFDKNSANQTHTVGAKAPNPWGLFDMHGNVSEWCSDWYGDYPKNDVTDPRGPPGGESRVIRGGNWGTSARLCRSAYRGAARPSRLLDYVGFRVAMSLPEARVPQVSQAGRSQRASVLGTHVEAAPTTLISAKEKLQQRVSLSFPRDTLEMTIQVLADEIGLPITIRSDDLQLEGITKNQSFGLDEQDKPAEAILRVILMKANPAGNLIYVIRGAGDGDSVEITTKAAAAKRGDAVPETLKLR